jgi:hypothetical protein
MSQSNNNANPSSSGRYRFCGGRFINPNEGVHPEMADLEAVQLTSNGIPASPSALIAMQENRPERPEKPEHTQSANVKEVLDLIEKLDTSAYEDQQIALAIVRHLERFHDEVVEEMENDEEAKHSQISAWAVDADRLMHCRIVLESINLE